MGKLHRLANAAHWTESTTAHLLNHQVSKWSSCSSTMRLHSKLLLSHNPSTISISRISLWTEEIRCWNKLVNGAWVHAWVHKIPATRTKDVTGRLSSGLKMPAKLWLLPKGRTQTPCADKAAVELQPWDQVHKPYLNIQTYLCAAQTTTLCCLVQSKRSPDK